MKMSCYKTGLPGVIFKKGTRPFLGFKQRQNFARVAFINFQIDVPLFLQIF